MTQRFTQFWRNFWNHRPQAAIALVIFLVSALIYLGNGQHISSNDNVPNSLLAFNWLEHQTLHLDAFRDSYLYGAGGGVGKEAKAIPYFFTEAPNGHLTSTYPIGAAILAFPLYVLFWLYLKLGDLVTGLVSSEPVQMLDITAHTFENHRQDCEKLAGALLTALSVGLFYLASRLKFSPAIALMVTFLFAFATPTWAIVSQGLRQHTASNLVLILLLLALLKANRVEGRSQRWLLLGAGVFCGLLPGIRLTSLLFAIAIGFYVLWTYRKNAFFFILGLPSLLLQVLWNFYFFGIGLKTALVGGYGGQFDRGASSYRLDWAYANDAFWGQLFSPSDGLLVFSPILLLAVPGAIIAWRHRGQRDEKLILALSLACVVLFFHYCVYVPWTGGSDSFGPRFLSDILPVLGLLMAYGLDGLRRLRLATGRRNGNRGRYVLRTGKPTRLSRFWAGALATLVLCLWSTGVQAIGAFTATPWGRIPLTLVQEPTRIWHWHDSQIQRHATSLWFDMTNPLSDEDTYLSQVQGAIMGLEQGEPPDRKPLKEPLTLRARRRAGPSRMLWVQLQNTGTVPWYGYQSGMDRGETRVRARLFRDRPNGTDSEKQPIQTEQLYVSGLVPPGATAEALGLLRMPHRPGTYWLVLDLEVNQVGEFPATEQSVKTVQIQVDRRPST